MPRVTSKGQVTIPIAIRDQLGIHPGSEVEFDIEDGAARLRKKEADLTPWLAGIEAMRGTATSGLTTDEIMAMTRGED